MSYPTVGTIVQEDSALAELIDPAANVERLAVGLTWSEGPVWDRSNNSLLFSDIPRNSIFRWSEPEGLRLYMYPSGYTGVAYYGAEPGSNGLVFDAQGRLTACEHGDRRISRLEHNGGKKTLVDSFEGKRLNSPNDLVFHSNGDLYFTDPAYGFPLRYEDPTRELPFCGVYRLRTSGEVDLLTDELINPNGLVFTPDEKTLYVSQSNPERAIWMAYPVRDDGSLDKGEVFLDVTEQGKELPGLPDGMTLDERGNIFATGPGGVYVMTPDAKILGRIDTGQRTANVCWGDDGSTLYITAHMLLCRVRTRTKGPGW